MITVQWNKCWVYQKSEKASLYDSINSLHHDIYLIIMDYEKNYFILKIIL